jgi:hypothetical protein
VTAVVLLILAVIWAAVLVPPWLQNRKETRPGDSIASFRQQLSVLERTTPGRRAVHSNVTTLSPHPVAPAVGAGSARPQRSEALRRADARRRRREVFLTLLGATGLTFVLAVILGGPVWTLHLAVLVLFAGYVGMLLKIQQQTAERDTKVRYLPANQGARPAESALLLRRSGS